MDTISAIIHTLPLCIKTQDLFQTIKLFSESPTKDEIQALTGHLVQSERDPACSQV